jgi:hypothetical protein
LRTRRSICVKKQRFASAAEAELVIARADIALRAYRCDRCQLFHLTSRTKGKRIRRPG